MQHLVPKWGKQRAETEFHGRLEDFAKRRGVASGHVDRVERNVRREDAVKMALEGQRERDRTGTRSDVCDPERTRLAAFEHALDEDLRLDARDEHALVHFESQMAERRPPDGVCQRSTNRALHRRPDDGDCNIGRCVRYRVCGRPELGHVENRRDNFAGFALWLGDALGQKHCRAAGQQVADGTDRQRRWEIRRAAFIHRASPRRRQP